VDDQGRPAAPPQYSPDGRWWWDGQRWVPVRPLAPAARPRSPRSRTPVWIAIAALLIGAIALTVVAGSTSWLPAGLRTVILGGGRHGPAAATYIATAPPPGADAIPAAEAPPPPAGAALDQSALAARVVPTTVDLTIDLHYDQGGARGSGIVLTPSGLVLTDEHVTFQADRITAQVAGRGRSYEAAIIGADPVADVALIQLEGASGLAAATFGDAATAHVDDAVIGVGYPRGAPLVVRGRITGLSATVSTEADGEMAAADYANMLESNLGTKPGMSGGPVVDSTGRVVGMIESGDDAERYTAAVRSDVALEVARRIAAGRADSEVVIGLSAELGVAADDATDGSGYLVGARVTRVHGGTPAEALGLRYGNTITEFGGSTITTARDLELALVRHHPGDRVAMTWSDILRVPRHGTVTLARGPAP
jgi:S1-C subfamily serine protease